MWPFVGGQLTHLFGWRSIFLVMGPLGAGSIAVTAVPQGRVGRGPR